MNDLLDDNINNNLDNIKWWKSKWWLYNIISIAIGLVLLFLLYKHYEYIATNHFEYFNKKVTLQWFICFAIFVVVIGNTTYYKIGKTLTAYSSIKQIQKNI